MPTSPSPPSAGAAGIGSGADRATPSSVRPVSARSPTGSGRRGPATSVTACPTSSTSASPGWPVRPSAPRSTREAKLLMMTHAFEVWEVHRVALQTDVRNKRSWAAIERIGGPARRDHAGRPPRGRRHGPHLGPLLHRRRGVAGGEGAADGAPGNREQLRADRAADRACAAGARRGGSVRPGRGWPRSCARGARARPLRPRPWAGRRPPPCRSGGSSRPADRPARPCGRRSRRRPRSRSGTW